MVLPAPLYAFKRGLHYLSTAKPVSWELLSYMPSYVITRYNVISEFSPTC